MRYYALALTGVLAPQYNVLSLVIEGRHHFLRLVSNTITAFVEKSLLVRKATELAGESQLRLEHVPTKRTPLVISAQTMPALKLQLISLLRCVLVATKAHSYLPVNRMLIIRQDQIYDNITTSQNSVNRPVVSHPRALVLLRVERIRIQVITRKDVQRDADPNPPRGRALHFAS